MISRVFLLVAASASLTGCGYFFADDIRLKREISPSEVVGVWHLRADGIKVVKEYPYDAYREPPGAVHEADLRADGTFGFRSIMQQPTRYLEAEGKWRIEHDLHDRRICTLFFELTSGGAFPLDFTEEEGRLVLWEYWSDPDEGYYLKYDRKAQQGVPDNLVDAPRAREASP